MRRKISVVISAYNEEKRIKDCVLSVVWADEIIVIDNSSTDKTADIAKNNGAKIIRRENNPMLNVNKNFGFSKATGDWILSLDADERVTPELKEEILSILGSHSTTDGYWIARKNIIFGKWIQSDMWWPDYQLRLFKKGKGRFLEEHVHEKLVVDGVSEKLEKPMIHENYSSVSHYISKLDVYTTSEATNIIKSGKKIIWVDAIRFPLQDFLKTFFAQNGYKDGLHGLVLSILQAFYMELVFVKIWEKQGFVEYNSNDFLEEIIKEGKKAKADIKYWILTTFLQENKNPAKNFLIRIMRRFR